MKRSRIKPISEKRRALLGIEALLALQMLEACEGKCMACGKMAPLEKSHTRDRKRFIMSCHSCHWPADIHRYLDDYPEQKIKEMI